MKNKSKLIFTYLAVLLCTFTAAFIVGCKNNDCDDNTHRHSYSTEWSYDGGCHWHKATCEHTSEVIAKAMHNLIDGRCLVCDYEIKEQLPALQKKTYDMSRVVFDNLTVKYDGQEHFIFATNLPEGVSATYEGNGEINAGIYTITAHFIGDSVNYNSIPDKNAILTITRDTHKVTFKQEGQADIVREVLDLSVLAENDIPKPEQTKIGYSVVWEEKDLFEVTEDIIVNAIYIPKQYNITFLDRGSDSVFSGQFEETYPTIHTYDSVTQLVEPVKEGYVFTGWFNDSICDGIELTELGAQDYTDDITLYARWAATITFNTDGGTEISPITQNPGTPVSKPEMIPQKKSCIFVKWQYDDKDYVFDVMPDMNITLNAVWDFYEDGTEFYPYIISNKDQLVGIEKLDSENGSSYFELVNDIDLEGTVWNPIKNFYGKIEGNNYRIFNFSITTMPKTDYQSSGHTYIYESGLFCSMGSNSIIQNLDIDEFSISVTLRLEYYAGYSVDLYVGGLAGRNSGMIENCYATGSVNICPSNYNDAQPNIYAGGLVGENSGEINHSHYSLGTVYGKGHSVYTGGIAGNNSGTVKFCWTSGTIYAFGTYNSYSGGLVAKSSGTISNCYATGNVKAHAYDPYGNGTVDVYGGGLVGDNRFGNIYFSYAMGDVSVSQSSNRYAYGGGLVGRHTGGLVLGCFATGSLECPSYQSTKSNLAGLIGGYGEANGTITMSTGYNGQVIPGKPSSGCTFLQLNDVEFYLNELGWNGGDWDLNNLDFLNGLYPKLAK